jgi:oligopeptide/dipeptide ABC transporter ATP-binding protein
MDADPLLRIEDLAVSFDTEDGEVRAVDRVSLDLRRGEVLGMVGESGCGKTVTAMSIMRLVPSPPGRIVSGSAWFGGRDLLSIPVEQLRGVRGREVSMIFQEPMTALSPLHRVGRQLCEAVLLHERMPAAAAAALSLEWLGKVGVPDPRRCMEAYPHQLSGGMRQRAMIAMALMMQPRLLIADEPTTALDVTIQAQVLDLLRTTKRDDMAILFITHDMGIVWELCDRVAVMYAGEIAETGETGEVFGTPGHPYTEALLASIPARTPKGSRLVTIPGQVASSATRTDSCRFADRCRYAFDRCRNEHPALRSLGGRSVRCHLAADRIGNGGGAVCMSGEEHTEGAVRLPGGVPAQEA